MLIARLSAHTWSDDFQEFPEHWAVEQMPGGLVTSSAGTLTIRDRAGCSIWFKERLKAPLVITYEARLSGHARVSDLNCFWMASNATGTPAPFAQPRSGVFKDYDTLTTYYAGIGGNTNTTSRFRRYDGSGARPLLPEHDLRDGRFLLEPDRWYQIRIEVSAEGQIRLSRDGMSFFEWKDPAPLLEGWFAFRTVDSELTVRNWTVRDATP